MFKKILIANRGEIAVRIIRTCREMGIPTVAIYSEVDRGGLPVRLADEAFCVGGASTRDSYLNIPNILSGADALGVEAIHPGYGFLSENARFVKIIEDCNFKFIGPAKETVELGAIKDRTCEVLGKEGLPIVPGYREGTTDIQELCQRVKDLGYPLLLKASGGGGGKGMRIVQSENELKRTIPLIEKEAEISFGSKEYYVEKYLAEVKHIEFQMLGDKYGNIVHLGERECTIQRRHQKLIEESPSPSLTPNLREEMAHMAIKGVRALKYHSLGTMEFILNARDQKFYFIEINTRIQVEHPVTEMVYGLDLVRKQIEVAAGVKLPFKQTELKPYGHAIECRILAEDTERGFAPSTGKITELVLPGGIGVRVDTHIYCGYEITPFYDSLLAKLICWGKDRLEAITRTYNALGEFHISGVKTNLVLLRRILKDQQFIAGDFDTHYLEKML